MTAPITTRLILLAILGALAGCTQTRPSQVHSIIAELEAAEVIVFPTMPPAPEDEDPPIFDSWRGSIHVNGVLPPIEIWRQLEALDDFDEVTFHDVNITAEHMRVLRKMKVLRVVEFEKCRMSLEAFAELLGAPELKSLKCVNTVIRGDAPTQVRSSPKLETIDLFQCSFPGAMGKLLSVQPEVQHLAMSSCQWTGAGMNQIGEMAHLHHLRVGESWSDADSKGLLQSKTLQTIHLLESNQITGKTFGYLGQIRSLRSIDWHGDDVTEADLLAVATLPHLRRLSIRDVALNKSTASALIANQSLRELKIWSSTALKKVPVKQFYSSTIKELEFFRGDVDADLMKRLRMLRWLAYLDTGMARWSPDARNELEELYKLWGLAVNIDGWKAEDFQILSKFKNLSELSLRDARPEGGLSPILTKTPDLTYLDVGSAKPTEEELLELPELLKRLNTLVLNPSLRESMIAEKLASEEDAYWSITVLYIDGVFSVSHYRTYYHEDEVVRGEEGLIRVSPAFPLYHER